MSSAGTLPPHLLQKMHFTVAEKVLLHTIIQENFALLYFFFMEHIDLRHLDIVFFFPRQETCPCCRKPINHNLILVMYKLSKSIGRLKIKVRHCIIMCCRLE